MYDHELAGLNGRVACAPDYKPEVTALRPVKHIFHVATVLHEGWELDNKAWHVLTVDGDERVLTTSHGALRYWTLSEAKERYDKMANAVASLHELLSLWPKEKA